jgi:myo-inositol-1(or 4)-monophosphatase
MNYSDLLPSTVAIARHAGSILLKNLRQPIARTIKTSDIDFVTAADKESEAYIVGELTRLYPTHHIVGEEGGGTGANVADADYLWFVDPLDGTVNFASGIPHFAVSIALTDKNRKPLLGVVYDPNRDECFTGIHGQGSFLNGERLQVTTTTDLSQAILASGFAYDRRTNPDNNVAQWGAFINRVRDLRRYGSAALDLSYVACARFDGYWERSLNPWDTLAGMVILREAGGIVSDYNGGDQPQFGNDGRYVASNAHLHPIMLEIIQTAYAQQAQAV